MKKTMSALLALSDDELVEFALTVPRRTRDRYIGLRCGMRFGRSPPIRRVRA